MVDNFQRITVDVADDGPVVDTLFHIRLVADIDELLRGEALQAREITLYQNTQHRLRLKLVRRNTTAVPPVYGPVNVGLWRAFMTIVADDDDDTTPIIDADEGSEQQADDPGNWEWSFNVAGALPMVGAIAEFLIYPTDDTDEPPLLRIRARVNILKSLVVSPN